MSFRTRLTGFFIVIVVVPMVAVGLLVFRLINDSQQGKADARASGLAAEAGASTKPMQRRRAPMQRRSPALSGRCTARRSRSVSRRWLRGGAGPGDGD